MEALTNSCDSELDLLKFVCNTIVDGLIISEVSTKKIIKVNDKLCSITGFSSKDILKEGKSKLFHRKDLATIDNRRKKSVRSKTYQVKEIPIITKSSEKRWVDIKTQRIECNQNEIEIDLYTDVTERVLSKSDVDAAVYTEQENQKLISLIKNSNDFIAFASLEGKVEFVNKSGRDLIGLEASEDIGSMTIADFLTEEGLQSLPKSRSACC